MRAFIRKGYFIPDTGRLQVGVYRIDPGSPAGQARVRVLQHGRPETIIDELYTDESGQTPEITLPTPPLDYSLEEANFAQPYSEYDIEVELDGYDRLYVDGVQILPTCLALQPVNIHPLDAPTPDLDFISIQPQTLFVTYPPKIPEPDVKELPPSTGFVVLPEPIVPETIVVHNGLPTNASAQNYWVPYKDYIKNVASCEIYATWPEECIKANVLAIISFTLNRVFTEWYRSKGYYFTITNSTQYDHAFNYGRNIFEEISVIVDEVFSSYITKPGIRQPLFAQYCDGKRSSCPNWMTQWGSKDLGDQGYSALEILQHFYGSDVYIARAEKVEGTPMSYPGVELVNGSSGMPVRAIQEQLNVISNNYPVIGKLRVDGQYGGSTIGAVEAFQKVFKLPVTGRVDYATWYK
ncbi:MAG: peptidoglycan-binding protein, partial [Clostridiales bacterium]|nr:peptidoglycan-binding protein [Clostridiales bacterium]